MAVLEKLERWTATTSEEECRPRGPIECRLRAVALLGPFKYRTHDEANRFSPLDGRIAISEQLAIERVEILARDFNGIELLNKGAPRSKHVVERLNELEVRAGEFAQFLESLDDMTRLCLQTAGTGISKHRKISPSPLMADAEVDDLPALSNQESDGVQCAWVRRLSALSQFASSTRSMFLTSQGIEDPDLPDKGGNTTLYKRLYGSAAWHLVQQGWHLYDMFKPGGATGSEGGSFHLFLHDVFEYATGLEPEKHAKLTYWLKNSCGPNRRMKELREREDALGDELNSIEPTRENQGRIAALYAEQEAVAREIYEIWPALYPHSYPKQNARK